MNSERVFLCSVNRALKLKGPGLTLVMSVKMQIRALKPMKTCHRRERGCDTRSSYVLVKVESTNLFSIRASRELRKDHVSVWCSSAIVARV